MTYRLFIQGKNRGEFNSLEDIYSFIVNTFACDDYYQDLELWSRLEKAVLVDEFNEWCDFNYEHDLDREHFEFLNENNVPELTDDEFREAIVNKCHMKISIYDIED